MEPRVVLGQRIAAARVRQRYDVKGAAAAAGIARDTWNKIEAGQSVQDTKRQAALDLLDLDEYGHPREGSSGDERPSIPLSQIDDFLHDLRSRIERLEETVAAYLPQGKPDPTHVAQLAEFFLLEVEHDGGSPALAAAEALLAGQYDSVTIAAVLEHLRQTQPQVSLPSMDEARQARRRRLLDEAQEQREAAYDDDPGN